MLGLGIYRPVWRYFPRYARALAAGTAFLLASRILMVYAPRLLRRSIAALEDGGAEAVGRAIRAGWLFLAVTVLSGLLTYAMRRALVGTSRRVERDLKRDLFVHIERLPAAFFDRMRTGDLIARLTSDVEAVRFSLGPGLMYVAQTAILFPLALASMLDISWRLTLVALVPLLAILAVVRALAPAVMRRSRAVQDRIGDISARAQESFAGARVIRAYATEDLECEAFRAENARLVRETLGLAKLRGALTGSLHGLGGMAELAVLWYGGLLVVRGDLRIGDLVAFIAYVGMLIWPMISVGWVVSSFQRAAGAVARLHEIWSEAPEPAEPADPARLPPVFQGHIEIRGLTFSYPGAARPALEDVSLELRPGGTLGLVGPVGGGKTTILALLARLYEPPPGTVFLDGIDVTRIPLAILRAAFSVVPQDAFLFSDTIRENLAYAVQGDLSPERAWDALAAAGFDDGVRAFPEGIETVVGERGLTLSGGEKQRATIARALLRPSPIILLDDALSAVDTQTEARILDGWRSSLEGRTRFIAAHRLSTVRHADRIVVLDAGRVAEAGTHEELLARGGWYARTFAQQRLESELEGLP
ncbi:MAG: ABC transporter ATP-binding protein [Planctomycetes bacterium]|nr:ABC transporter ATP-binding protein [Planctomycetota bacterium]